MPASAPCEVTAVHTRLLRLALGVEEARAYWENLDPNVPAASRPRVAFEARWFGAKSLPRIRFVMQTFTDRYDAYPEALEVLRAWRGMDGATRQVLCHVHLCLADPLYRRFTGRFLVERRDLEDGRFDRHAVIRFVKAEVPERWSEATYVQFASKLLSAASEAGLVSPKRDPRKLLLPKVPDVALAYVMYLLRGVRIEGALTDNLYLASLGLTGGLLDQRLRALRGITYRRMGALTEIDWDAPDLFGWAKATL